MHISQNLKRIDNSPCYISHGDCDALKMLFKKSIIFHKLSEETKFSGEKNYMCKYNSTALKSDVSPCKVRGVRAVNQPTISIDLEIIIVHAQNQHQNLEE